MNTLYGEGTLVVPEARLGHFPRLPGTDGSAKMSKSLRNGGFWITRLKPGRRHSEYSVASEKR